MRKEQLLTGDIIVDREGYAGVVIRNEGDDYILYQEIGLDYFDDINDDLTCTDPYSPEADIMEVHRDVTFWDLDHEEGNPIWRREFDWKRPTAEERKAREEQREQERQEMLGKMRAQEQKNSKQLLTIVSQAFYGNRTTTQLYPENLDLFILGYLDYNLPISKPIDRTVIQLPNTDGIVIVYNKFQEERAVTEDIAWYAEQSWSMKPLAVIPELDLKLYSKCIACRMNAEGELESVRDEDYEVIWKYFVE